MATSIFLSLSCRHRYQVASRIFILSSALVATTAQSAAQFPPGQVPTQFNVVPLGTFTSPSNGVLLRGVNSLGEAVGSFKGRDSKKVSSAFIAAPSAAGAPPSVDEITDQLPTDDTSLYGINDSGEVVGAFNAPTSIMPFRSVRRTGFQVLPLLNRDTGGIAYGINENGESVGTSSGASGERAVWWTRKGDVTGLPSLPNYTTTKAIHINKKGDIIGYAGEDPKVAVLWPSKGSIVSLENLFTYTSSQAESISDKGDIVGYSTAISENDVRFRAVLWPSGSSRPEDLGALTGGRNSRARDVDDKEVVVGTSESSVGNRAFIWTGGTGIRDLNSLSNNLTIILTDALSINKKGEILAVGINTADLSRGDTEGIEEHHPLLQIVLLTPLK